MSRSWARSLRAGLAVVVVALGACGTDRPYDARPLPLPMVPGTVPDGYVLLQVDERPTGRGGRWFDITYRRRGAPASAPPWLSLHQRLDVNSSADLAEFTGRTMRVGDRPAECVDGTTLRWLATDTALLSLGDGALRCEELLPMAASMALVDSDAWAAYVRSADRPALSRETAGR